MKTIRAVTLKAFGGADMLQVSHIPEITLSRPNDVLIRVMAAGVNRADISQRRGHYPPPKGCSEILGLEVSGVVEKVGDAVTRVKEGDRVMALLSGGGYAEQAVAHEGTVMKIPKGYSFIEAAAISESYLTAWQSLKIHCNLQEGQKVLVHAAASGLGVASMQLADKFFGATVVATSSAEKVEFCKKFASVAVDRAPDEGGKCFANKVRNAVGDESINVILDPVVGGTYLAEDGEVLTEDGKVVLLAYMGGPKVSFDMIPFFRKRAALIFTKLRNQTDEYRGELVGSFEKEVIPYFEDRVIAPVVQSTFSLEDVAAAHDIMESNKTLGKIVLKL
ncbi:putative oxidoreductase [Trypanosoma grayi]|uniref:putative oxidoreductase n=1 Tax=Trypanosoma grayi TaxID=71804 RepID=UPI0004F409D9|nr:putative oxidoreductase [Trypanosoma grayi]KEG14409.1 putative oxidoreductase [Trypanosoma grayi]